MLFGPAVPEGLSYQPDFITAAEERALVEAITALEFSLVEMRGAVARRRTVHYGWTYGYYARRTEPGPPLPGFLAPLRAAAAEWAGLTPALFVEALITEYTPGAPIGWHRDAPMFGDVIAGISLLSPARMKFRRYVSPKDVQPGAPPRRTTHELDLAPRSAYLMSGASRHDYEHSIPPLASLRYSITFRTLRS